MTGVSYIVTVYNKLAFLPLVLDALFTQTGAFEREFVIVDDGSTDGSLAFLQQLCAGRNDVRIIAQANAGPAVATNVAVRVARFPWLKIVDADDVLAPWCTEVLLDGATRLDLKLASGGGVIYRLGEDIDFGSRGAGDAAPQRHDLFSDCLRNVPSNLSVTLVDRALYWQVGGCDERIFTQDYSLLLRLSWRSATATVGIPVSASPSEAPGRVSDNVGRMLRDTNQALLFFLTETEGVPARQRRRAIERAFGRAWKWQRRKLGAGFDSRWFWLYVLAKLGAHRLAAPFLPATLRAFGAPASPADGSNRQTAAP